MNNIIQTLAQAPPDGWVEGVTAILISVLSWYLGRRRGAIKERDKRTI